MSIQSLIFSDPHQLEDQVLQDVIEIRRELPKLGYRLKTVYKEARNGLRFCALYERIGSRDHLVCAIAYIRVSMYQQSNNLSLVTQVQQILALAEERGQTITRIYVEAGLSGADNRRPAFQALMRDATHDHEGQLKTVYCYDLYRFFRNQRGLLNSYGTLFDHNVRLTSVADKDIDLDSKLGHMIMAMRSIMGEMYLDDLSRTVTDNKFRRASQGYSNASLPPLGYCRGTCTQCSDNQGPDYCPRFGSSLNLWRELADDPKVFVPHPIDQHAVRIAYQLHITGDLSDTDIARRLSRPHPEDLDRIDLTALTVIEPLDAGCAIVQLEDDTVAFQHLDGRLQFFRPKGRPGSRNPHRRFSKDTIRDLLQNPFYAGFVLYRKQQKERGRRKQRHKRFKGPLSEINRQQRDDTLREDHGILFPGLHIPIISVDQFDLSQQVRGTRGHTPTNQSRTRRVYPLSGVLKCHRCRHTFRGNAGSGNVRYYDDSGVAKGSTHCPRRMFRADPIEQEVFALVEQLLIPNDWLPEILPLLRDGPKWDQWRREKRAAQSRLNAGHEMRKADILSNCELLQLERKCKRYMAHLQKQIDTAEEPAQALLRDFPRLWAAATLKERRGLVRSIFLEIWLRDGVVVAYRVREPFVGLLPIPPDLLPIPTEESDGCPG